ncbi:MAG: peptidase signal peptidase [Thermoleophilia bacterium]|nr:peptidase signal peptidase [Thermoleophilia bacterium]
MNARTIVTRTSSALVVLAAVALLVFAIGPHTGAYRTVSILSGSMAPTFSAGDAIITVPIPTSAVQVGDVITFHAPIAGRPVVTHRVTNVDREGSRTVVRTKGDANDAADPWEARLEGDIAWRQATVIPHAGTVLAALRSGHVGNSLVYGGSALLVVLMLMSIWIPSRHRSVAHTEDQLGLDELLEAIQADLMSTYDATCVECGSSTMTGAACPFCDEVVSIEALRLDVA